MIMRLVILLLLCAMIVCAGHGKSAKLKYTKVKHTKKSIPSLAIDQTPVLFDCPYGYELIGNSCSKTLTAPLVPVCFEGVLNGNRCENYAPWEWICPSGTILNVNNMCTKTVFNDFQVHCPPGFQLSSGKHSANCFREIPQQSEFVCPPGTEPYENGCATFSDVPPIPFCPENTMLWENECITSRVYDCLTGGIVGGHGKQKGHSKTRSLKQVKTKKGKKSYIPPPPLPPRPAVFTEVVNQECRETIAVSPTMDCPQGSIMINGICTITHFHQKEERLVGNVIEAVPSIIGCAVGWEPCRSSGAKYHGGKKFGTTDSACCRTEELPAERICPVGYEEEALRCVAFTPLEYECQIEGYIHQGDQCLMTDILPAIGRYTVTYECQGPSCVGSPRLSNFGGGKKH